MGGVILARDNQDLRQSFSVAKDFFAQAKPGAIKFVLIGLSPYIVPADEKEPPTVCPLDEHLLEDYFKLCVDNGAKPVVVVLPIRQSLRKTYKADVVKTFRETIDRVGKKYKLTFVDLLDDPCMDSRFLDRARFNPEGVGPAFVSAFIGSRLYIGNVISLESLLNMPAEFFDTLNRYYPNEGKTLTQHVFCAMACDHYKKLAKILPQDECRSLMARAFCEMTYNHLAILSNMLPKDDYNEIKNCIFNINLEKIRRKDKIKVGFVLVTSSTWCGDDLYDLFANDKRFETTVFFKPIGYESNSRKDFTVNLEKFKAHGINVFETDKVNSIPEQDILIQLWPYNDLPMQRFRLINLKLTTLMVHFNYGIGVEQRDWIFNSAFTRVLYRIFCSSTIILELYKKACKFEPCGVFSGHPKMDIFFKKDADLKFDWKMTRPDAKKIIWAPHWSIDNSGGKRSNFRWNHQFMYEFAKAHPEISWVVKPHPSLFHQAIFSGIFPSNEALKEYFQKWDDLPNAQVYTGAYYQDIFATSDGMIHDCGSFTAEYQYVDKPMIYLTRRDSIGYNRLGEEILKASYTVDGQDLDGIAATIQRVIIDGDDDKAAERKEVFDKYLNYPKLNGMLASEFIYKNIKDELELNT